MLDLPKNEILNLYFEKKWSFKEIAKKYNCSPKTIEYRLKEKWSVDTRSKKEQLNTDRTKNKLSEISKNRDYDEEFRKKCSEAQKRWHKENPDRSKRRVKKLNKKRRENFKKKRPDDKVLCELYESEEWSIEKIRRNFKVGYYKLIGIFEENDVSVRSHKEACNTQNFKQRSRKVNEGKKLTEEHKRSISEGINNSEKFQKAMEKQSERLRKDVSNDKIKRLYFEHNENARKVSEFVDLSRQRVLVRLKEEGIDTSQDEPWNKGKEWGEEVKEKMSKAKKGKSWEEIFGEEHAEWRRENIGEKISEAKQGHDVSRETRKKLRKHRIKQIEDSLERGGQIHPSYNPEGCWVIEEFGKKYNYSFQHAENGGEYFIEELGYWVDGYDESENIVVEYDEMRHFGPNGSLKKDDRERMEEIINCLDCGFVRVKSKNNEIYLTRNIEL